MKKILLWWIGLIGTIGAQEISPVITVGAMAEHMAEVLCVLIAPVAGMREVATIIKQDLEFTKQLSVTIIERQKMLSTKQLEELADTYMFILFLSGQADTNGFSLDWRLYDAQQAVMLDGKRAIYEQGLLHDWADHIADQLWMVMMGKAGFFSTKIAYCKQIEKRGHTYTCICIRNAADTSGATERILVKNDTVHVALRWNRDQYHPLLLYSESTPRNIRLCVVNVHGRRRIVSNFDGINMQASYAPDEQQVVVCLVQNGNSDLYKYHFNEQAHKGVYEQLTPRNGRYFDPWWADNNRIYFSSDALKDYEPAIGYLDPSNKQINWITTHGYCTNPVYCSKNGLLAYLKKIQGVMQIMLYNERTQQHTQLTYDQAHKATCCWAASGEYLVVALEEGKTQRIAICNVGNGQLYRLTPAHEHCYHPAWAPFSWTDGVALL